jgi:hypothetical protein
MRIIGKFSLFFIFLTSAYILPASSPADRCHWWALWAETMQNFGLVGAAGQPGEEGRPGQNRESVTLFADGSRETLDLSGQNGGAGGNGADGNAATCSQPQQVGHNLQAASGGNGGDGGNGGNGGNGGSLTVYTTNLSNLRQIAVNTIGGKAGQGGTGGKGGKGCNCTQPYWNVTTCTGKPGDPNYNCTTREFRCQDGQEGKDGRNGSAGRDGLLGKLTLIALNKPLEADRPAAVVTLADLKDKGFTLSQNRWETRTGATALFAPGSAIDDRYLMLVERRERSFLLRWNAPQSFSKFAKNNITLSFGQEGKLQVVLSPDLWLAASTQQRENLTEFVVDNAILRGEATQLASDGISGNGTDLQLTLTDRAGLSNLVATKFLVKYQITRSDPRFRPVSEYTTKYEGEIPAELVKFNNNRFTFNLGKLPIEPQNFREGLGIQVEVVATRTFAGYSAQQTVVVKDVIGPFR